MSKLFRVLAAGSVIALGGCALGVQGESSPTGEETLSTEEGVSPKECTFRESVTAREGIRCRTCAAWDCTVVKGYLQGTELCLIETTSGECIEGHRGWDRTSDGCWIANTFTTWPTKPC